jgi:anti-sigma B factor antagonist
MTITERKSGHVTVVSLEGNLFGEPDTTEVRDAINRLKDRDEKHVVLDLGSLKAINSTGLGMLVTALTSLRKRSGDLYLARLSDKVHSLMMITHLVRVFKIYDTVERAMEGFGK